MGIVTFQQLPSGEIARLMQEVGCKACVYSVNWVGRWFILKYLDQVQQNFVDAYLNIVGLRHLDLYRLFFQHGIDTLLTPMFVAYEECDILYSHLYSHQVNETYSDFTPEDWETLILFYRQNHHHVLGIGR